MPDPIFAVIAEHRTAVEANARDIHEYDEDTPPESYQRCEDALWGVLTVQPTTLLGVAALLDHVGQLQFMGIDDDDADGETVLSGLSHGGDECDFARAARKFPTHLAETLRSLIGEEQS